MFNFFASAENNLGRAGWLLALGILGTAGLTVALSELNVAPKFALVLALVAFPAAAWFISKAAKAQGRSPVLYGMASLLPPLAILAFVSLYNRDIDARLGGAQQRRHDA